MKLDFDDLIIDLEAKLGKNKSDKGLLIEESFILWYALVEDMPCNEFNEIDLQNLLTRNVGIYQGSFSEDADFSFIIGWMTNIASWYLDPLLNEQDGTGLLLEAYRRDPREQLV
ncbi:hypothetical protein ACQ86N_26440 [Puia sp. P3]|uniref:hypothetical protein n=1 Tax=Puia sp. P3 TaxID=3423952 RepID=UPI003D67B9B3